MKKEYLLYGTAYLLVLLFANMYGFWLPFSVNVFAFLGLSDFLTSAIKFVTIQVTTFTVGALALALTVMVAANLVGWIVKRVRARAHEPFTRALHRFDLEERDLLWTFVILGLVGLVCFVGIERPYGLALLWAMIAIWIGLWFAGRVTRFDSDGPRKTFRVVAVVFFAVVPIAVYAQARTNAERVKQGCMPTRIAADSADSYGLPSTIPSESPTYLGTAGDYFFFYQNANERVWILRLKEGEPLGLIKADELPALCRVSLLKLREYWPDESPVGNR